MHSSVQRQRSRVRSRSAAASIEDAFVFEERNPLDERLLRRLEDEVATVTGCDQQSRVKMTVCSTAEWNSLIARSFPSKMRSRGLARHFRVLRHPRDPNHLFIGPSALSGLNEGHGNVIADLVYQMIGASGVNANQTFDRGVADLMAAEVADRMGLDIFTNLWPRERQFVRQLIDAVRMRTESSSDLLSLYKRDADAFFERVRESGFYQWLDGNAKRQADEYGQFIPMIDSIASFGHQVDEPFLSWAAECATIWVDYRNQQRRNALSGAAKRNS